ncbi:MAG: DUF2652 domain-containing protein [Ignavibacteriae bacterium]|nr:DUF2652 domain-containing protein [Ignavibacteriota bacterium]NOG97917.1 DUF2652 domain-containing protein [Ignavibacteriota bacterium]
MKHYTEQFNTAKLCDCICCNCSSELSKKFVVHYGKVSPVKIKLHENTFLRRFNSCLSVVEVKY